MVSLTVAASSTMAIPWTFKRVVDNGFTRNADPTRIAPYFEGLIGVVLVLALATAMRFYFVSWLGERTVADIRTAVQRNLLTLAPRWFEENRPSEIASRLTSDTAQIETAVGTTVSVALRNLVVGIGCLIYLFVLAPKLAASLIIGIPIVVLPIIMLGRRVRLHSRSSQDRIADIGAIAVETLGAMKIVQAFGQESREADRFRAAVDRSFETAKRRFRLRAILTALVIALLFGAITLIMWDAVNDVASGRLSGGAITSFLFAARLVHGSFL